MMLKAWMKLPCSRKRLSPTETLATRTIRNWNQVTNGGAISSLDGSNVEIMFSHFIGNQGLNGGAFYSLGNAVVRGSSFIGNGASVSLTYGIMD